MKNRILLLVSLFYIGFIFSCKMQSADDKLAIKISQSTSYNELMQVSKQMADQIKKYKADTSLTAKYKNLDSLQRMDSMMKYLYRTDSFPNISIRMARASKTINQDFPEIANLTAESRKLVFRKAYGLWLKANPVK